MTTLENYEVVLKPNRNWVGIRWREIWRSRDLIMLLVKRDFVARYKQTILGPSWAVIEPLLMTLVFNIVFNRIGNISTGGVPGPLFYMCGLLAWKYFAQLFQGTGTVFAQNADLFNKVYFPRLVVPIAQSIVNLIPWLIQFATFMAFLAYYKFFTEEGATIITHGSVVFIPLILLHTAIFGLGLGFYFSSLTAKYRDFVFLVPIIIQLWMYVSAVVFPLERAENALREMGPGLEWILYANPMAMIVEAYKYAFLGAGTINIPAYAASVVVSIVLFVTGIMFFQRTERNFQDYV